MPPLHAAGVSRTTLGVAAGTTPAALAMPLLHAGGVRLPPAPHMSPHPLTPPSTSPRPLADGALSDPATPSCPPTSSAGNPPNPPPASLQNTPAGVRRGSGVTTPSPLGLSVQTAAPRAPGTAALPMAALNVSMTTLTPDDFPQFRPMSNALKGLAGTRGGRGGGRGGCGGRGGRGGRGGHRGRGGSSGRGGRVGSGEAEMTAHEEEEGADAPQVRNTGTSQSVEQIPRARMLEIRAFEKKRDAAAAREARHRDHGVFVFPRLPVGHEALGAEPAALGARVLPTEPEVLGPRSRRLVKNYEPPKKRTMVDIRADAAAKREAVGQKRKGGAENEAPVTKKK
ncbi:hypothetical protein DFH08DRAFT_805233 [Mycena albidolilacea]|nr:hypothetical protein DFH08DRAFT_805233 [Mycena albidolilacea]